jgi:hypothetical protein
VVGTVRVSWVIAIAACVAGPPEPGAVIDPGEPEAVAMGPTCGNGAFDATELCVANPGATVITTGEQVVTVLAVDVNADAIRDVVAATASRIWIRYGTATGFGSQVFFFTAGASYTDVS